MPMEAVGLIKVVKVGVRRLSFDPCRSGFDEKRPKDVKETKRRQVT